MLAFFLALALFGGSIDVAAERTVILDINQQRAKANVAPLQPNEQLHAAAVERANDMASRGYFDHTTPEGTTAFVEALRSRAFPYSFAGENIAVGPSVTDAAQALWLSPSHRDNLLDGRFHRAGIAVVRVSAERLYVVQLFSD